MIQELILLLAGFFVLIKGADWLVDGSVDTAERFRISPLVIGLTIVAFGTSSPELVVNLFSSLDPATSGIGLGNIIGSNIANIGLIIGASALILPLAVKKSTIAREIPIVALSSIIFLILVSDKLIAGTGNVVNKISRADGIILLLFFVGFIYFMINAVVNHRRHSKATEEFEKEYEDGAGPLWKSLGILALGLVGVVLGGKLVVDSSANIATTLGVSDILIGLTVVAIGTSLPELVTSIVAAYKKEADVAVGNILGSNIFNTFFVLGINAVINPIPFDPSWFVDAVIMIAFSIFLYAFASSEKVSRREGVALLTGYLAFFVFTIIRG